MSDENTIGREPVQIVELTQPRCGNVYGKGVCRGTVIVETLLVEFKGDNGNWTSAGTLEFGGHGALRQTTTGVNQQLNAVAGDYTFNGDDARYIIVRGRSIVGTHNEWAMWWASDFPATISSTTKMFPENLTELQALSDGEEFIAVYDASTSTDYAAAWVGSLINDFRIDFTSADAKTIDMHSISISASNPLDKIGLECYNTRATCQDPNNYRHTPEFLLTADVVKNDGDTVTDAEIDRTENLFAAVDVYIPASPTGIIWEQGGTGVGSYLGFTSGELVWRTGNGSALPNNDTARIAADASAFYGKNVTILFEYVDSTHTNNLWVWDEITRVITLLGTDTAITPDLAWAGTASGGVGTEVGTTTTGEDNTDYNGDIHELRIYNSLAAPNMTNPFVIPLFFSGGFVAEQNISGADYILPSLLSVSTQPTKINLSSANTNATGLGNRAVMSGAWQDHPHTDNIVDPYLSTRLFDPMDQGSFWSKWFVRNKFRFNMLASVHEGYIGQTITEMKSRSYILTGSGGPSENGKVAMQFKDILAKAEERKAQAPIASNGVLVADITSGQTTFSIAGATSTEYEASGTVRIGDELITYSSFVANGDNFDFTVTSRGTDGTTADAHSLDDTVQSCLRFTSQTIKQIVTDLLVDWSGISRGFIDQATFTTEVENYLSAYILSTVISEPTSVSLLLSELQEQVGFYIWWHERDQLIKMSAVRGVTTQPDLLTDEDNIIAGSFSMTDQPRSRVSQVWFSYGQIDKTESLTTNSNYLQTLIQADLPSENADQYGEKSIRKINSRWIDSGSLALSTASKIIIRYSTVPRRAKFKMDAKDRALWVGDTRRISHFLDVDETGLNKISTWTIVGAEEVVPGETVEYEAEDTTLYGKITLIQANGSADYDPDTATFSEAFIGDNDGLLSDGTNSARIT